MFRALKVFFAFLCLLLTTTAYVDHVNGASVTVPTTTTTTATTTTTTTTTTTLTTPSAGLNGPVVIASQPSAVSANLRKNEEDEVDLEGV
jgi:hypothetical protein